MRATMMVKNAEPRCIKSQKTSLARAAISSPLDLHKPLEALAKQKNLSPPQLFLQMLA
jgi:hypothetical protein